MAGNSKGSVSFDLHNVTWDAYALTSPCRVDLSGVTWLGRVV